jgi:hypothetical protein
VGSAFQFGPAVAKQVEGAFSLDNDRYRIHSRGIELTDPIDDTYEDRDGFLGKYRVFGFNYDTYRIQVGSSTAVEENVRSYTIAIAHKTKKLITPALRA